MDPITLTDTRFEALPALLRELLLEDLTCGVAPAPMLVAHHGEVPLAIVVVRPFETGELGQAVLELLALLLPLGADRLVLSLPGRGWSNRDPVPPVCEEGDLRQRLVVTVSVDGSVGTTPTVTTEILTVEHDDDGAWQLGTPLDPELLEAPVVAMMGALVAERHKLHLGSGHDEQVVAQLGRVLLLGHELALSPTADARLAALTTTPA